MDLTTSKILVLAFVAAFRDDAGIGPTVDEIAKGLDLPSVETDRMVHALCKAGYADREDAPRSIIVTETGYDELKTRGYWPADG